MKHTRLLTVAAACAALIAPTACTDTAAESILDKDVLRIGVRFDLPLVAIEAEDGTLVGYEIDVANYIADHLGVEAEFVQLTLEQREGALLDDEVDLAIATYSITQGRKQTIDFAGPYLVEHFDIMVRAENHDIATIDDLEGHVVCEVRGSSAIQRIEDEHGLPVEIEIADGYDQCMDMLERGAVDALATDEFVLTGLASEAPFEARLVGAPFSQERIGVGMRQGDTAGCEAVNRAITAMYNDGTAQRLLDKWMSNSILDVSDAEIPQFEGCQ